MSELHRENLQRVEEKTTPTDVADFLVENSDTTQTFPLKDRVTQQMPRFSESTTTNSDKQKVQAFEKSFLEGSDLDFQKEHLLRLVDISSVNKLLSELDLVLPKDHLLTNEQKYALERVHEFFENFEGDVMAADEKMIEQYYLDYYDQVYNIEVLEKLLDSILQNKKQKPKKSKLPKDSQKVELNKQKQQQETNDNTFSSLPEENQLINRFFSEGEKEPQKLWETNFVREKESILDLLENVYNLQATISFNLQNQKDLEKIEDFLEKYSFNNLRPGEQTAEFFDDVSQIHDAKKRLQQFVLDNQKYLGVSLAKDGYDFTEKNQGFYEQEDVSGYEKERVRLYEKISTAQELYHDVYLTMLFDEYSHRTLSAFNLVDAFFKKYSLEDINNNSVTQVRQEFAEIKDAVSTLQEYQNKALEKEGVEKIIIEKQQVLQAGFEKCKNQFGFNNINEIRYSNEYIAKVLVGLDQVFRGERIVDFKTVLDEVDTLQYYVSLPNTDLYEDLEKTHIKEVQPPFDLPQEFSGAPTQKYYDATPMFTDDVFDITERLSQVPEKVGQSWNLSFDDFELGNSSLRQGSNEQSVTLREPLEEQNTVITNVDSQVSLPNLEEPTEKIIRSTETTNSVFEQLREKLQNAFYFNDAHGKKVHWLEQKEKFTPEVLSILQRDISKGLFQQNESDLSLFQNESVKELVNAFLNQDAEKSLSILQAVEQEFQTLTFENSYPQNINKGLLRELTTLRALLTYPTTFSINADARSQNFLSQLPYQMEYFLSRSHNVKKDIESSRNIEFLMGKIDILLDERDGIYDEALKVLTTIQSILNFEDPLEVERIDRRSRLVQYHAAQFALDKFNELINQKIVDPQKYQSVVVKFHAFDFELLKNEAEPTVHVSREALFENHDTTLRTPGIDTRNLVEDAQLQQLQYFEKKQQENIAEYEKYARQGERMLKTNQLGKYYNHEGFQNIDEFGRQLVVAVDTLQAFSNHNNDELNSAINFIKYAVQREINFESDLKILESSQDSLKEVEELLQINNQNNGLNYNLGHIKVTLDHQEYIFDFYSLPIYLNTWIKVLQNLEASERDYWEARSELIKNNFQIAKVLSPQNRSQLLDAFKANAFEMISRGDDIKTEPLKNTFEEFDSVLNAKELTQLLGGKTNTEAIIREARLANHSDESIKSALSFLKDLLASDNILKRNATQSATKIINGKEFTYMGIGNKDSNSGIGLDVYVEGLSGRRSFSALEMLNFGSKKKLVTQINIIESNQINFDIVQQLQEQF